ncbi:hypothetical protein V5N11_024237 [Cardamine amara subsp. amara]|uniref:Uncharacterized protein n=1 Tax=Cardamine amara subsp. amara TaxID=228776 RepID=A0ABD1BFZ8_CARAN
MAEMDGTHSQTPIPLVSSVDERYLPRFLPPLVLENNCSSQIKLNSKRKLEDYLDPVLLHTISSRIGRSETKVERKVVFVTKNQRSEFDWPIDLLDPLINDPESRCSS